jgi:hypothetical protein
MSFLNVRHTETVVLIVVGVFALVIVSATFILMAALP